MQSMIVQNQSGKCALNTIFWIILLLWLINYFIIFWIAVRSKTTECQIKSILRINKSTQLTFLFIRCFVIVNENMYFVVSKLLTRWSNHAIGWNRSRELFQPIAWFAYYKVKILVYYVETPYQASIMLSDRGCNFFQSGNSMHCQNDVDTKITKIKKC